ncbi:MAG TPA: cytochrome P450 [Acidimicrobiia bacterium]|jgi:cytochrome P450|nr:cytochrome P450 [Acidimicrobiia bacterium]
MGKLPSITIHWSPVRALRIFDADRLRWLDEAAAVGPVVALRLGPLRVFVVTDPDAARTMLLTDSAAWTRPPTVLAPVRAAVGDNLFSQAEPDWARLQPLVAPAFRTRALAARLADMDAIVAEEVRAIPYDEPVDLELAMGRIALIVAAWVLLGDRLDRQRADEIARHEREVVAWVGARLGELTGFLPVAVGARGRAMKRNREPLLAYGDEVIARARADHDPDDVLGTLLRARPGGRALEHDELRGHVLGLFLAGNETTAAALEWALVHGARNAGAWQRLRADPARWAEPFVTETLRLTPAVWGIPRTPTRAGTMIPFDGGGQRVRRGQTATVNVRGIGRDAKHWPDPLQFDPARHETRDASARALIPFGLGPRGCIGQHLALAELHAALPALAHHGDVEIDGETLEDPQFALRVVGGLRGRFRRPQPASGGC